MLINKIFFPNKIFILPKFQPQTRVINKKTLKKGTIHSLRLDNMEKEYNWPQNIYHYRVNYDDKTFELWELQSNLEELP